MVKAGKARELKERIKACEARGGTFSQETCVTPLPVVAYVPAPYIAPQIDSLTGSLGYTIPWGNCVNQVPYAQRGPGNPINWGATSSQPYIGAVTLFYYNHTGVVTGIWSNGDLEIRHENGGGLGHRFPRSTFRGFR